MPKHVEKGKTKQRRKPLGNGWTRNILKSLGYSAMDVITEMMPNTASVISGITETRTELHDTSNMALEKAKELSEQMQSKLKTFKEEDLRAAIEDIKSGQLHSRLKDSAGLDDGDLDFGGLDENFDFGEDDFSSSSPSNVTVNVKVDEESPMVEAQVAAVTAISDGVKYSSELHKIGYASIASSIAKMSVGLSTKLDLVHSEVAKISTVIPKSLTEHTYLSAKYYQDSIGYQKQISESLLEMKDLYIKSTKVVGESKETYRSPLSSIAYGLDVSEYKDLVKKQFKDNYNQSMIGVTINMLKDMYNTQKMADDGGFGKTGVMETLTKSAIKHLIPSVAKKSGERVDDLLQGLLLSGGMKIGNLSKRWDSPLLQFIGDTFGVKSKPDLTVKKEDYEKGAVAFDGKVHRAITDVIPTYLRVMTSALTGKEEVTFDYEKGKFNTVRNIRENFKKELRQSATDQYFSETWDFNSVVDSLKDISQEQNKEIKESFQNFIYNMAKSGDFVTFRKNGDNDDIAKYTGRSTDDPVVQLIREYFEGMIDQGRQNEVNEFFSSKLVRARQSLEEKHKAMTKDATTGNFNVINNGLTERDKGNIRATAEGGLLVDKYGRTSHSYLRDILGTLATGIRVVNVGTVEGDPTGILTHSNQILSQLSLDHNTLQANILANAPTTSQAISQISINMEEAMKNMVSILEQKEYGDWLDDKAEYSDENKLSGKIYRRLKRSRDKLKRGADSVADRVSNAAIDAIYGTRNRPTTSEFEETDSVDAVVSAILPDDGGPGGGGIAPERHSLNLSGVPNLPATPGVTNIMVGDFHNKLKTMGNDFVNDIIHPLNHALFNEEDGLITQIEETELNDDKENEKEEDNSIKVSAKETVKSIVAGEKDEETGEYKKGLISDVVNEANKVKAKTKDWAHEMVFGSEDGSVKGINQYLRDFFGQKEDGSLSISEKAKEGFGAFKEHFKKRAYEWTDIIFGPEEGEEKKLDVFLGDMKGKKGLIGASAVVGALGSFFLPGGPITGALIGSGLGMVTQSTQLKNFLFGETDEETGERTGGLITKEWQDYFKKVKKPMTVGSGVGLLGSFFLPGGPITGALIGSGLGMATKSEAFSKLMYGDGGTKEDPTGGITKFIKDHYSKDKDVKSSFMDAGIGAGVGLLGSFFLPGGPITGALIGAATNIAINTGKFKDFFFGKEDEGSGKREGGVFGGIKTKVEEKFQDTQDKFGLWVEENITNPLKVSMDPIKKRASQFLFGKEDEDGEGKGLVGKLADRLDQSVFGDLKRSIKENIVDKMKDGFHKLFGGFFGLMGTIIKSPFAAIQTYAEGLDNEDASNINTVSTFKERLRKLNEESKRKREEMKAARRHRSGRVSSKKQKEEPSQTTEESKAKAKESEDNKVVATVSEDMKEAVETAKIQLDVTKSNHEETKGLLTRIADAVTERLGQFGERRRQRRLVNSENETSESEGDGAPVAAASGRLVGHHDYLDSINNNVKKILNSVDGQLNGTGWNLNRIYKLLRKKLKKDGNSDDDEDADDEEGRGPFRRFHRFRDLLRGGKGKLKSILLSPFTLAKKLFGGIKKKISDAIGTILKVPKAIIGTVKKVGSTLIKTAGGILKSVMTTSVKAIKKIVPAIIGTVKKVGLTLIKTAGGILKTFGGLMKPLAKGFVTLLKDTTKAIYNVGKGLLKTGWKITKGIASGGVRVAKNVAGKIFHRGNKQKDEIEKHFVLDGGTLDTINTVNIVKMVEDIKQANSGRKRRRNNLGANHEESLDQTNSNNVVAFPRATAQQATVGSNSAVAAGSGTIMSGISGLTSKLTGKFAEFRNKAAAKGQSTMAKIKGSAASIKAKFASEDAEEKKQKFLAKITGLLTRNTESTEKHSSVWSSIFSKKGLITAGLILLSPLIFKAVKGIINFLGESGLGAKIVEGLGNVGAALGKDAAKSFDQEGGMSGIVNNASEQARAVTNAVGLTKRKDHIINSDGTIATDENGNPIYEEKDRGLIGRTLDFYMPVKTQIDTETGKAHNNRVFNHDTVARTENTYRIAHRTANKMSKFANSKIGKVLKGGASKAGSTIKDLGGKALKSDKIQTIIKLGKKAIQIMLDKLGDFVTKHGGKAGNLIMKVGKELIEKVLNGNTVGQFIGKFAKCFTKTAAAAGTALASDVVAVGAGAIGGALNAAELFEVRQEDVDTKMRLVAAALKGLANLSCFCWLDVIFEIFYSITGINVMGALATAAYKAISSEEDDAKLDEAKDKFDSDYEAHLQEEYEAYAQNEQAAGNTPMSFEEFKGSDLATSKADYNTDKNHFSITKTATKVWNSAKNKVGDIYGKAVDTARGFHESAKKGWNFIKGMGGKAIDSVKGLNKAAKKGMTFIGDMHDKGMNAIKGLVKKKKEAVSIVFKDLMKAWFDTEGGYYISNGDGTFNYYNTNGELMTENVDGEEVNSMIQKGLLVSDKIPSNAAIATAKSVIKGVKKNSTGIWGSILNSAKEALKEFQEAAKEGWEYVKNLGKKAWNGFADMFNRGDEGQTESGGKGDESSAPTSASGTVNGFSYYSQNDPSIRNKPFNLSSGETDTMGARGCGPTAMSMVASQLTGQKVDPVTMAKLATNGGYSTDVGTTPEYFQTAASSMGINSRTVVPTKESIAESLRNGNPVILQGQDSREDSPFTSGGHYVVGVGMNGNNLIVNDPRGKQYSKEYDLDSVLGGVQNVWGFSKGGSSSMDSNAPTILGMGGKSQGVAGDTLNNFPYFLQGDDRWGGTQYSVTGDPSQTIASSACGPTSMAMVLRSYGANVTPVDTAKFALENGYRTANSGTSWGFFNAMGSKYGLTTTQLSSAQEAVNNLQNGNPVIASMGPSTFTKGGHYIVLSGINGEGRVIVNDPGKLARSNVTYDPSVFASEGKQFWSFTKDGKGSINNVQDAGEVKVMTPRESMSTMVGGAMDAINMTVKKTNPDAKITEGTPEGGTISNSQAESVEGTEEGGNSATSIVEFLAGAASAFLSPIMDKLMGKKGSGNVASSVDGAVNAVGGLVSNTTGGINPATGEGISVASTPSGLSYARNGDYLGKYTAQFESGNKGPTAISTGAGDYGGVSFGTYQFATQNAAQVGADSQLARFWDANYAANHPGVAPGNNQAFKDAWLYEANADMKGFQNRETAFMADNFYRPQLKKISDIVNPDSYDRGLQEDIYATSIQFGPHTGVIKNALAGKDVSTMKPEDVINAIQDYKVANNASLFASSSQKIRDAAKHRHDVTERKVMLELAGKPPINPMQVSQESNSAMTDAKQSRADNLVSHRDSITQGGFGDGPKVVHTKAPKPLIGGKGEEPSSLGITDTMTKGMATYTPSIQAPTQSFQPTVASKEAGNVLLNQVIELLGYIVENTSGINTGVQELYHKDFSGSTQLIATGGNNSIIPLSKDSDSVDPRSTKQYETAKQMSAGIYLN